MRPECFFVKVLELKISSHLMGQTCVMVLLSVSLVIGEIFIQIPTICLSEEIL